MILNIGCGTLNRSKKEIGYDIDLGCKPDVCGDIENLPFKDESFSEIRAIHVFEHVKEIVASFNECYRIMEVGGRLHIRVPLFPNVGSIADPTHVRYFVPETFGYFVRPGALPGLNHLFDMGDIRTTEQEIYCILRKK